MPGETASLNYVHQACHVPLRQYAPGYYFLEISMNNQLQISWVQPCEENSQISHSSLVAALQKKIKIITCRVNKIGQSANSLNSTFAGNDINAHKVISRNILR